jgi:thiol:disulfide interchange protein DsbA
MRLIQNLLFALTLCGLTSLASASPTAPKEGTEYLTLAQAQPTDAGNKIEVLEFFSYACPHCYAYDPILTEWVKKNASNIVFKRVHVGYHPAEQALQRTYVTLEAMGQTELYHQKLFVAIHKEHQRLTTPEALFEWMGKNGGDVKKFLEIYNGFSAPVMVNRAQAKFRDYKIEQWPMVAVGGHYLTSPYHAGQGIAPGSNEEVQQQASLQVLDFLLAKAQAEKK